MNEAEQQQMTQNQGECAAVRPGADSGPFEKTPQGTSNDRARGKSYFSERFWRVRREPVSDMLPVSTEESR